MTLHDWLSVVEPSGIYCNIYIEQDGEEAGPIYEGFMSDTPYWLADMDIAKDKPIWWGVQLRGLGRDGFVITLTEKEKN